MLEATLSAKNQIGISRERRRASPGTSRDKLHAVVRGERVIDLQKPKSHRAAIRGLTRGVYSNDYLQKERQSWD